MLTSVIRRCFTIIRQFLAPEPVLLDLMPSRYERDGSRSRILTGFRPTFSRPNWNWGTVYVSHKKAHVNVTCISRAPNLSPQKNMPHVSVSGKSVSWNSLKMPDPEVGNGR